MAKIENLNQVIGAMRQHASNLLGESVASAKAGRGVSVIVGFTAEHAIWVHEMAPATLGDNVPRPSGLGVFWGPSGHGPKYLEAPARELGGTLAGIVRQALRAGQTIAMALILAGLRLQREAQLRVPVEYGILRASAFTRMEE